MDKLNQLERRIVELSYKHHLSHISSCLNCVNLIDWIYDQRKEGDPFCLDNGHASLAHYVVLEKHGLCDAEEMVKKHGVHSSRDMAHEIWCSNGSLGQAATVAVGMALADQNRTVWLVTSDGACMEGSVYESFRFARRNCPNLKIHVVYNGYGAYGEVAFFDINAMESQIFTVDEKRYPEWLQGLAGHYLVLTESQRDELLA